MPLGVRKNEWALPEVPFSTQWPSDQLVGMYLNEIYIFKRKATSVLHQEKLTFWEVWTQNYANLNQAMP